MTSYFSFHNQSSKSQLAIEKYFSSVLHENSTTRSAFMMTTRLIPVTRHISNNDFQSQHAFDTLQTLYKFIYSHLVNNWTRPTKHHLLPISFDFLDDPRSKPHNSRITTFNTTPHIHSIVLFRHEHQKHLSRLSHQAFYQQIPAIESVHLKPINPHEELKTFNYASKLLQHPIATTTSLYDFNPHPITRPSRASAFAVELSL